MIIAILVIGLFGYGMTEAYKEEKQSKGLICETSKPTKCRGFKKTTGFKREQENSAVYSSDFDALTDADFVKE